MDSRNGEAKQDQKDFAPEEETGFAYLEVPEMGCGEGCQSHAH